MLSVLVILALSDYAAAHSWVSCTDYRGDMNYYQDEYCMSYPRGWTSRADNSFSKMGRGGGLKQEPKGFQMARGFYDHEPCGRNNRRRSGGQQIADDNACQAHHYANDDPDGQRKYPDYTEDFPAAIYEAGGRYCIAWAMKNHAAAGCMANGGSDDTRLYYHPVKPDGTDPKLSEFKKYNIRGPACKKGQDSAEQAGAMCQMTGEKSAGRSNPACTGYQRAPRYCEDPDLSMGSGCFDVPVDLKPGKYHFAWYWLWASGVRNSKNGKCDNVYLTCWEGEVVAKGSAKARTSVTPGTKGLPDANGLGYKCTNSFSDTPEPARPPPPTPPPTPAPIWNPSDSSNGNDPCAGSQPKDSSLCSYYVKNVEKDCIKDQEMTVCNSVCNADNGCLCGEQKMYKYCPRVCGCPNRGSSGTSDESRRRSTNSWRPSPPFHPPSPPQGSDFRPDRSHCASAQASDSSICNFYVHSPANDCGNTEELMRCNSVSEISGSLCGNQPLYKYCPHKCGCSSGSGSDPSSPSTASSTRRRRESSSSSSSSTRRRRYTSSGFTSGRWVQDGLDVPLSQEAILLQENPTLMVHTGVSADGTKPRLTLMNMLDKSSMQTEAEDVWEEDVNLKR